MNGRVRGLAVLAIVAAGACGNDNGGTKAENRVFFTGYVYDGATGMRLDKTVLNTVSVRYGEKTIAFNIADDGRFVSRDPLPTWQDYRVSIDATDYRAFTSYNTGVDLPASLAMTDGVAQASITQTLDFAAYVFPVALKAPMLTLTITEPDPQTSSPVTDQVNGQLRLRPQAAPSIQLGGSTTTVIGNQAVTSSTSPIKRVWSNGEDLLTQTISMPFTNGNAVIAAGAMVYGVSYQLTIFGVDGFQPWDSATSSNNGTFNTVGPAPIVAGFVTSETVALAPETQDPLRIVSIDGATCVPPDPTSNTYGGKVTLTFNYSIEIVGSTFAQDIDNAIILTLPQSTTGSSINGYCQLGPITGNPMQQRGSKVEVGMNTIAFSFNPTVGISTMSQFGAVCMLPPAITTITYYAGQTTINVQPKGKATQKRSLSTMLNEKIGTSQLTCPQRTN